MNAWGLERIYSIPGFIPPGGSEARRNLGNIAATIQGLKGQDTLEVQRGEVRRASVTAGGAPSRWRIRSLSRMMQAGDPAAGGREAAHNMSQSLRESPATQGNDGQAKSLSPGSEGGRQGRRGLWEELGTQLKEEQHRS